MLSILKDQLQKTVAEALASSINTSFSLPSVEVDVPNDKSHGDFSCNIALKSAKIFKKNPMELAGEWLRDIESGIKVSPLSRKIKAIEVKKPGFINFFLSNEAIYDILYRIFDQQEEYGRSGFGRQEKIQIEFVSANPTGPLSVAHARQAAVGDALAKILNFIGFDVNKEYYVNDEGNQINLLGQSILCRCREILGEPCELPAEGYQGEYIKDVAMSFLADKKLNNVGQLNTIPLSHVSRYGIDYLLSIIKNELKDFNVHFDHWAYQSVIATSDMIEDVLAYLGEKGFLYEKDGALWFKSTDFEDDKDRVLEKSDGSYTYFTPDIVYHRDKFKRGFHRVVNIWGPDHHGYIPRLKAAVEALGQERSALEVLIVQLASIFRDGKPIQMSTRKGQYIQLREVIEDVGVDAARFFFLMRHINAHLDFDLALAKAETPENPVYYIQYAHARVHSIHKKARTNQVQPRFDKFHLLTEAEELALIKVMGEFPDKLIQVSREMDPFAMTGYLMELATSFHKFYDCHRVVDPDNKELTCERLALVDAVRIVLANGLRLIGVSQPRKM